MKKKNSFAVWFWLAVVIIGSVWGVRHFHVKNFNVIKPDVLYTSGQPRGMDYTRLLYKYHIATFVNTRSADEHREHNWHNEEITWMKSNGANYIELPIEKHGDAEGIPDAETIERFLEIMRQQTNLPVIIHGSSGTKRVAYLAAAWMLKAGGFGMNETIAKVEKINGESINKKEREFLQSLVQ